jgi:hypothetical protein
LPPASLYPDDNLRTNTRRNAFPKFYPDKLRTIAQGNGFGLLPKKKPLFAPFMYKCIILPRQARDKHRESTQKKMAFRIACRYRRPRAGQRRYSERKRKDVFLSRLYIKTIAFYQHRLGTNIGKSTQKQTTVFFLRTTGRGWQRQAASQQATTTSARCGLFSLFPHTQVQLCDEEGQLIEFTKTGSGQTQNAT